MSINIESSFSFDGSLIIKESLTSLKTLGYSSLGLTDNNSAFYLTFYKEMKKMGIKPLLALRVKGENFDYLLYALNFIGYKELLSYASSKEALDIIKLEDLIRNNNLAYVLDSTYISSSNIDILYKEYETLKNDDLDVYIGVDFSYYPNEIDLYRMIDKSLKIIIINKIKYINKEDKESSSILSSILKNTPKEDYNLFNINSVTDNHIKSYKEFKDEYKNYPNLLENTLKFIDKINIEIEFKKEYPLYPTKDNIPSNIFLKALSRRGLLKRLEGTNKDIKKYKERLNYELKVIDEMGFSDYFLVVYDYILYSKKNNMYVGPGRGSSASSLVSYSLGIVDIDPMEYNLYFERFLNKDRKTMPDIDTDFEDRFRDEIIRYVSKKYGEYHVSMISTFQTFKFKSAIKEVSRLLEVPDIKSNSIIEELKAFDEDSIKDNKNKIKSYRLDPVSKKVIDISLSLLNIPRSISTHAAGIIISNNDLRNYTEVHKVGKDFIQSTYDSDSLKDLGLLKMDFLSLSNLSIIHDIVDEIYINHKIKIDLNKIPLNDIKTFECLNKYSTTGIFQLESLGMSELLKKMKVNNFLDLSLLIALYRPGPKENIPIYLRRREGLESINYYDDSIKDILKETLGIIVYQEQVMAIVSKYSGLSLGEADIFRKAMSDKDKDAILKLKDKFILGAEKLNRDKDTTIKLFNDILKFGEYGFNKAHSVSYAKIAYILAYLKANYPKEFMIVMLKNSRDKSLIKECFKMNITVKTPDLRYSDNKYIIKDDTIYMPYIEISGIGQDYQDKIIKLKDSKTFESFVSRAKNNLPRGLIEALIYSSVFDYLGYNKKTLIDSLDGLYEFDPTLIKGLNYKIKKKDEFDYNFLKNKELELLGFNSNYHPLKSYKGKYRRISDISINVDSTKIIGLITNIKKMKTKNNENMASCYIEDEFLSVKALFFPKDYIKNAYYLKENKVYIITGSYKENRGENIFYIRNISIVEDNNESI